MAKTIIFVNLSFLPECPPIPFKAKLTNIIHLLEFVLLFMCVLLLYLMVRKLQDKMHQISRPRLVIVNQV